MNEQSPKPLSMKGIDKILFQMKNCVCKIYKSKGEQGSGFFCKITDPSRKDFLYFLITCKKY